ncbi:MAG: class I SAM-dependent methyltransferase [Candidatus Dormibacteraeota bacterium]|nr:class I SAM-dependent methyltransferase [Candidatus Dormibacteraeota bacterium]
MSDDAESAPAPLACASCSGRLWRSADVVRCGGCGTVGRVVSGVWDFGPADDYAENFGDQWSRFRHTQLDSCNGTTISRRQFELVTGWSPDDMRGQVVLDAGCGAGRYSEIVSAAAAQLVALDLSAAVYAASENLRRFQSAVVVRADLMRPPLNPGSFDRVFSIGVLQHTPDPTATARQLLRLVRPGGELAIWMYERRWYTPLQPKMLLRRVCRHLSPASIAKLSDELVATFTPVARRIPSLKGKRVSRLARAMMPIANYWGTLPLNDDQQYDWSRLDTHDWLSPTYDKPQRFEALSKALFEAGATRVSLRQVPGLAVIATQADKA